MGAWVAAIVVAIVILGTLGLKTTTEFTFTNNPESQAGLQVLEDAGLVDNNPTDETSWSRPSGTVDDPAFQAKVEQITADLRGHEDVVVPETVVNYYELSANPATAEAADGPGHRQIARHPDPGHPGRHPR